MVTPRYCAAKHPAVTRTKILAPWSTLVTKKNENPKYVAQRT